MEEFNRAKDELEKNLDLQNVWGYILSKYNPTLIGECEKAIKWAETIVTECLGTNMLLQNKDKTSIINEVIKNLGEHALTLAHRHISRKTWKILN